MSYLLYPWIFERMITGPKVFNLEWLFLHVQSLSEGWTTCMRSKTD